MKRHHSPLPRDDDRYPWIAMGVVLMGTFMVILDSTIVNVALPAIGAQMGAADVEWTVTAYLIAVAVAQLATGWTSDRYGKKRVYTASLALFGLGSLLVAVAPNLETMIVFRVLQGLGGGAMMPVGLAMIYELFPPDRRGTALGIWGIAAMAAPAFGPVMGGWITNTVSWRWVFAINVPIGMIGTLAAARLLRDVGYRDGRALDLGGLGLASVGLVALLLAFDKAPEWGWTDPTLILLLTGGVAALAAFTSHELRIERPLLDVRMFAIPTFSLTIAIVWLTTVAQFARLVFLPVELQTVYGLNAFQAGLVLAPAAAGTALTMPLGGRIADRLGARLPVVVGTTMIGTALWLLGALTPDTPPRLITAILALQGAGFGLAIVPNTVAAMNSLPNRWVSSGSAVRSLNRQVAGSVGVAVLASLVSARLGSITGPPGADPGALQAAYSHVFRVALAGTGVAGALALFLPGKRRTREAQARRAAEYAGLH